MRGSDHKVCIQEEPETERSGYECAPYNVLETTTDYQVFVRLFIIAKVCLTPLVKSCDQSKFQADIPIVITL